MGSGSRVEKVFFILPNKTVVAAGTLLKPSMQISPEARRSRSRHRPRSPWEAAALRRRLVGRGEDGGAGAAGCGRVRAAAAAHGPTGEHGAQGPGGVGRPASARGARPEEAGPAGPEGESGQQSVLGMRPGPRGAWSGSCHGILGSRAGGGVGGGEGIGAQPQDCLSLGRGVGRIWGRA